MYHLGDIVEQRYENPLYSKLKLKEIDEIGIELRTLNNRLVPFDYGVVVVTLIFKKLFVF